MRIAFDAKRYFNNRTGLGNYSRGIVHALAKKFPEHEFILIHNRDENPLLELPNLKTLAFPGKGSWWRTFGMANDLKKHGIDIFHGLSNEIPRGLKKNKISSVVTIHDVIFMRYPSYYKKIDRMIYTFKTKYAVKHADKIVATSAATASDLKKYFQADENKVQVIYQPVHEMFYEKKSANALEKGNYFIYVSSFTQRKNHGTLIQAFSRIQKMTDWKLVLAGASGETLLQVKQFINAEKLSERIVIYENTAQENLVNLMQHAGAFVYPSFFEGFGIPLAEAAVCNLPVAASNIAVFAELAEEAAIYFHPNKYEEMADAMLRISNPELNIKQIQNLNIILNKIDPDKITDELMMVYLQKYSG